jgi:hypothetical protein
MLRSEDLPATGPLSDADGVDKYELQRLRFKEKGRLARAVPGLSAGRSSPGSLLTVSGTKWVFDGARLERTGHYA